MTPTITDANIDAFLDQSRLLPPKDTLPETAAHFRDDIRIQLVALASAAHTRARRETKDTMHNVLLQIDDSVWPLALAMVRLAVTSLDPADSTWQVRMQTGSAALESVCHVIDRLDPTERRVCTAVADKWRENALTWHIVGATRADIAEHFTVGGLDVPHTLDAVLDGLVRRRVVAVNVDFEGCATYRITP